MRGVYSLTFDRQKLISGGGDRVIKVWDWDDDLWCINTLRGHTGHVLALEADDMRLVSGSTDHTVRLWDWTDPDYVPPVPASTLDSGTTASSLGQAITSTTSEECVLQ